jgi:hypothetical protein
VEECKSTGKITIILSRPDIFFTWVYNAVTIIRVVAFVSVSASVCFGQTTSSLITNEKWFDSIVGVENSGIINGPEYKVELQGAKSNPFLGKEEPNGIVVYDGKVYAVPLLYDIYKDELVVKHLTSSGRAWLIQLEKSLVSEFIVNGRRFRNFGSGRGFHEIIFESTNLQVLAKRAKRYEVRKTIFNYVQYDRLFIKRLDEWTPFSRSSGFMKVLPDKRQRKELKMFLNQSKIGGRLSNTELHKVSEFLDELLIKYKE